MVTEAGFVDRFGGITSNDTCWFVLVFVVASDLMLVIVAVFDPLSVPDVGKIWTAEPRGKKTAIWSEVVELPGNPFGAKIA